MSVLSEGQIRSLRDMATRGMSVTEIMTSAERRIAIVNNICGVKKINKRRTNFVFARWSKQ